MANIGYTRMTDLADRLREAAAEVGGLNQLSELTGIPRRTLGNWLAGTQPKTSALERVANVASISLAWLVSGVGSKHDTPMSGATRILEALAAKENLGSKPTAEDEKKVSDLLGKGLARFSAVEGTSFPSKKTEAQILAAMVVVPRYEVRASAGRGALVISEDVSEHFAVGRDWLRRMLPSWAPPNAVVGFLEGGGDSMEPTIRDGDLIMIVQDPEWWVVERGGIFVFTLDHDRLMLKRLQVLMNGDLSIISDNPAYANETIPMSEVQARVIVHGMVFFSGGRPRQGA